MYCPNCGVSLNTPHNFCPNCGSQIPKKFEAHQSRSERLENEPITRSESNVYTKVPAQKMQVRPGLHSRKCLGFALASFIMGIIIGVIGLVIIIIFSIVGSIILLITHIVGLKFGISAKKHSKKAAELEPPNSAEKAGSVFAVFGIIINAILMVLALIFTIAVFIIIVIS